MAWVPLVVDTDDDLLLTVDPAEVVDLPRLEDVLRRPAWHSQARCRGEGVDRWFPGRGEDVRPAVAVCQSCPVQAQCLAAGLEQPEWGDAGIWGGSSAKGRRQLRRNAA